ncbi:TldD/PmbA family protein [Wolbachia pipientis]|uniref:TldD/PmbA family protein n=1 Tax=Wolbachia pipientis TaxID=955 RepID=UPI0025A38C6E|nr:TldD/PmbA family protein [Wolbachia pipientis]MDM8335606.1 TldD/PmbA family protein [Wolbachia pipientis]
MNILNIAADIIKLIKKQNQDAEVIIYETNKILVSQRLSKIEQISQSKDCTVGIRAIAGKTKAAHISTNDLNNLGDTVSQVVEMAKNAPEDPYINFAVDGNNYTSSSDLGILDNNVVTIDNLKEIAEAAENSALSHKNITNSEGASASHALVNTVLSTASGFIGSFSKSTFANQVCVVAGKESEMKAGYDYDVACNFSDLKSPELIGKEAAKRAIDQLNSRSIKTGTLPVIFEKRAAKELIKSFASAINGNNIINNISFLRNSLNTQIFNNRINIIDNPLLPKGIESRPFDGEGITSRKNTLVKNGVLQNWILDLYSAKKLNLETTGNATRASNAAIIAAASNLYIENDNISFKELIEEVKEGVYITDLFGFGVNLINGDYSQGASGFFIENGKITYPIHEITVASNLKDMFSNLVVANDLTFYGQFNSPTIKVSKMTVAGSLNGCKI